MLGSECRSDGNQFTYSQIDNEICGVLFCKLISRKGCVYKDGINTCKFILIRTFRTLITKRVQLNTGIPRRRLPPAYRYTGAPVAAWVFLIERQGKIAPTFINRTSD